MPWGPNRSPAAAGGARSTSVPVPLTKRCVSQTAPESCAQFGNMNAPLPPSDGSYRDHTWNSVHAAAVEILPGALRLLGVAASDLDDVVQEILLAAYKSLDRFDPAWSPPEREAGSAGHPSRRDDWRQHRSAEARWVLGIAWRKVSHHLDRAYRRREVPAGLHPALRHETVDPAPISEQCIAERERLELAREVLRTIAPERRVVLVLYEAYEVPLVDIARELGIKYNTASTRLRLAREDYRAAVKRLRPAQREALRACWLAFPMASAFLKHDDDASASAPPAPPAVPAPAAPAPHASAPPAPAPPAPVPPASAPQPLATPTLRNRLARIGRALGWAAAGGAGTAAVLIALVPPQPLWARRFGAMVAEPLPAGGACFATIPVHQAPEPRPVSPAAEALAPEGPYRPCNAAPRAAPAAGAREDSFAEERRLLAAAQETLSAGDPDGTLRQLGVHEQRFPAGRLKSVRERLRTVVRMRLAQPEQSASAREPSR